MEELRNEKLDNPGKQGRVWEPVNKVATQAAFEHPQGRCLLPFFLQGVRKGQEMKSIKGESLLFTSN